MSGKIGAKCVIASDRSDQPELFADLEESFKLNNVSSSCTTMELDWGEPPDSIPWVDVILGADVFYSLSDFENLFNVLALLMCTNPQAVFYTTYQERRC